MKAINREKLIDILKHNFFWDETIFEDELINVINKYGDDYFINQETKDWEKV